MLKVAVRAPTYEEMSFTRTERRFKVERPVTFTSESVRGSGTLQNISRGGLFVRTGESPPIGEVVEISVLGTSPPAVVTGEVRWVQGTESGEAFGVLILRRSNEYLALLASAAAHQAAGAAGATRATPRIELSTPVAVEVDNRCDEAMLCDISLAGARLEKARVQPSIGSEITLTFAIEGELGTFEVRARVVRRTDTGGYAVQFKAIDRNLRGVLEHALSALRALPDAE